MNSVSSVERDQTKAGDHLADQGAGWAFARRPFWLFSHAFALGVVVLFIVLGLWQMSRHGERIDSNEIIEGRMSASPLVVDAAPDLAGDPNELDYRPASVDASYLDGDYVRVVNRSQGGVAGEYVVGIVTLSDGSLLAVNRGFVPANADPVVDPVPDGQTVISGWLRPSVEKGRFGANDSGQGDSMPRFNTDDISARLGQDVASVWLQVQADDELGSSFPDPVPLPPLDAGPHLGYAAQWFIFALLGTGFYLALLWRFARQRPETVSPAEPISESRVR